MINTDEINDAVQSFQNTVEALKNIEAVSDLAAEQLDSIRAVTIIIKKASEKISEETESLAFQSDKLGLCVEEAKKSNEQNTTAVIKKMHENKEEIDECLRKETIAIERLGDNVRSYTLSTQSSIDEFRITQNRNAIEIRESISEAKKSNKSETDKISQRVSELSEKVIALEKDQKTEHALMLVGVILAAIASIASIIGLAI